MSERVGQEVRTDDALLAHAQRLWATGEFRSWRTHMRQDVEDSLRGVQSLSAEGYPEEA